MESIVGSREGFALQALPMMEGRITVLEKRHQKLAGKVNRFHADQQIQYLGASAELRGMISRLYDNILPIETRLRTLFQEIQTPDGAGGSVGVADSNAAPHQNPGTGTTSGAKPTGDQSGLNPEEVPGNCLKSLMEALNKKAMAVRSGNFSDEEKHSLMADYQTKLIQLRGTQMLMVKEAIDNIGSKILLETCRFESELLQALEQKPEYVMIDEELSQLQLAVAFLKHVGVITTEGGLVGGNVPGAEGVRHQTPMQPTTSTPLSTMPPIPSPRNEGEFLIQALRELIQDLKGRPKPREVTPVNEPVPPTSPLPSGDIIGDILKSVRERHPTPGPGWEEAQGDSSGSDKRSADDESECSNHGKRARRD